MFSAISIARKTKSSIFQFGTPGSDLVSPKSLVRIRSYQESDPDPQLSANLCRMFSPS